MKQARLVLEDGKIFTGTVFSDGKDQFGEVIFNTAMSGYQEVLTDPSYKDQLVVMTYPLIGNYGINDRDHQSKNIHLQGLIIKEYCDFPSNWESTQTLKDFMESQGILGVEGIDTRALTRHLRDHGAKKGVLTTSDLSDEDLVAQVKTAPGIMGKNLAAEVSTETKYTWRQPENPSFRVAVVDCGVKFGILDHLADRGCSVDVYPYNVPGKQILNGGYDGVMISNGPGDPEAVPETIATIQALAGKLPMMGICLGHQMLCLAFDMKIMKLEFGHHGLNHPILYKPTGKVEISSQNHIYCTDPDYLHPNFEVTHVNLNDDSIAGVRSERYKAFSVQHHPEASPGPFDCAPLFDQFIHLMTHQTFATKETEYAQAK